MTTWEPETFQVTKALKESHIDAALLTDGRFSGVSSGPCIGHIGPEAIAGGPIGKIKDGDIIEVRVDCNTLKGDLNFRGIDMEHLVGPEKGAEILAQRPTNPNVKQHPAMSNSLIALAAIQQASGGTWGGCVIDGPRIAHLLKLGMEAERRPIITEKKWAL